MCQPDTASPESTLPFCSLPLSIQLSTSATLVAFGEGSEDARKATIPHFQMNIDLSATAATAVLTAIQIASSFLVVSLVSYILRRGDAVRVAEVGYSKVSHAVPEPSFDTLVHGGTGGRPLVWVICVVILIYELTVPNFTGYGIRTKQEDSLGRTEIVEGRRKLLGTSNVSPGNARVYEAMKLVERYLDAKGSEDFICPTSTGERPDSVIEGTGNRGESFFKFEELTPTEVDVNLSINALRGKGIDVNFSITGASLVSGTNGEHSGWSYAVEEFDDLTGRITLPISLMLRNGDYGSDYTFVDMCDSRELRTEFGGDGEILTGRYAARSFRIYNEENELSVRESYLIDIIQWTIHSRIRKCGEVSGKDIFMIHQVNAALLSKSSTEGVRIYREQVSVETTWVLATAVLVMLVIALAMKAFLIKLKLRRLPNWYTDVNGPFRLVKRWTGTNDEDCDDLEENGLPTNFVCITDQGDGLGHLCIKNDIAEAKIIPLRDVSVLKGKKKEKAERREERRNKFANITHC